MAPTTIDDVSGVSLQTANVVASPQAPAFVSYCPGELFKQCLRMPMMLVPPGLEECSTTATQRPGEASPQCAPFRPTPAVASHVDPLLDAANDRDSELSAVQTAPQLPSISIGSSSHDRGLCRPCGFVHHKGGCAAGVSCTFCHLCPPGTIERQRQMKRKLVRALQCDRMNQSNTASVIRSDLPSSGSSTPPEHESASSQCSTADTQSTGAESPRLDITKSTTKVAVDMQATGLVGHSRMQFNSTCAASADRNLAAASVAAAAAKAAAARVVALQKSRSV